MTELSQVWILGILPCFNPLSLPASLLQMQQRTLWSQVPVRPCLIMDLVLGSDKQRRSSVIERAMGWDTSWRLTQNAVVPSNCLVGQGADDDIVVASTRAYVYALNKAISHLKHNRDVVESLTSVSVDESMDVDAGEVSTELRA